MDRLKEMLKDVGAGAFTGFTHTSTSSRTAGDSNVSVSQNGDQIKITINGKVYHTRGKTVVIANRDIIIDGKKFEAEGMEDTNTEGFVLNIQSDTVVEIKTDEPVTANNIKGKVTCGILSCGDIEGDVTAKGPVNCGDITGNLKSSGPVNCGDVGSLN
jgi:hypothetical protein